MKTLKHYATLFTEQTIYLGDGTKVHFREANAGASKTYIVVHGLTGTHYSMLQMAGVWAERGIHVIALDLPGHGKSDRIEVTHFRDMGVWLHDVIETVFPDGAFTLVGNSFGSSVCMTYVQQFGLRPGCTLLLGAPIPTVSKTWRSLERLSTKLPDGLVMRVYYQNNLIEFIRMWVLLGNIQRKLLRERTRESIRSEAAMVQHRYAFSMLMPALYRHNPFDDVLEPSVIERTMSVTGAKDRIAGSKTAKTMQRLLGDHRVLIGNSGHLVHVEALPEVDEALHILSQAPPDHKR